jgi:hypothetical protein
MPRTQADMNLKDETRWQKRGIRGLERDWYREVGVGAELTNLTGCLVGCQVPVDLQKPLGFDVTESRCITAGLRYCHQQVDCSF